MLQARDLIGYVNI